VDPFAGVPGELIVGADGVWLGDFASEYVVPADSTRFSLLYPTGWTNCTWYELGGCNIHYSGCSCSDCCGSHLANAFTQRLPGDAIDPCETFATTDSYAVAIAPKICQVGCGNCRGPGSCCCTHPCDTVRCGHSCGGRQTYAGWPLVSFGLANPSTLIEAVADSSGPAGIEAMNAMAIDFSGAGTEGATFIGEGGGYDIARPPYTDSQPGRPLTDALKNYRSATNFTVETDDCLEFSCWVKAVPDRFGYVCAGYRFGGGIEVQHILGISSRTFDVITLDGTWQYLTGVLNGFAHELVNPMIHLGTLNSNRLDARSHCADVPAHFSSATRPPRGRVHVKAVHLAPCGAAASVGAHVNHRF